MINPLEAEESCRESSCASLREHSKCAGWLRSGQHDPRLSWTEEIEKMKVGIETREEKWLELSERM